MILRERAVAEAPENEADKAQYLMGPVLQLDKEINELKKLIPEFKDNSLVKEDNDDYDLVVAIPTTLR